MRDLRKILSGFTIVAFATVLALAGCGGSAPSAEAPAEDDAATEEAADDAATTEEEAETKDAATLKREADKAKAEEAMHWRRSEEAVESTTTFTTTDTEGNTEVSEGTSTTTTTYELDEKGNITKKTRKYANSFGERTDTNEETITFERDENGWPIKSEKTSTSVYEYPDGLGGTNKDENTETTEVEYSYKYDDAGRVTEVSLTDENESSFTFSYNEDGEIATRGETSTYTTYSKDSEELKVTSKSVVEYDDSGVMTHQTISNTGEEHSKQHDTEILFDESGNMVSAVHSYTYDDDSQGTETRTYTNEKNEDGFVTKITTTIEGDGKHVNERWSNSTNIEEVIMPDGSIQATVYAYNDDYDLVAGDPQTYEGPYCVQEMTYDEQGNMLSSVYTYYDGTVEKSEYTYDKNGNSTKETYTASNGDTTIYSYTYDENGNRATMQVEDDDHSSKGTYSYTYFEELSDYAQQPEDLRYWLER